MSDGQIKIVIEEKSRGIFNRATRFVLSSLSVYRFSASMWSHPAHARRPRKFNVIIFYNIGRRPVNSHTTGTISPFLKFLKTKILWLYEADLKPIWILIAQKDGNRAQENTFERTRESVKEWKNVFKEKLAIKTYFPSDSIKF